MSKFDRTDPRVVAAAAQIAIGTMLSTREVLDAIESVTQAFESVKAAADTMRLETLRLAAPLAEQPQYAKVPPRTPREQPYANPAKLARQERRHGSMRPGR